MSYAEKAAAFRAATALAFASSAESGDMSDGEIAEHADLLRPWEAPKHYLVGNLFSYDGMAFRVRQEHDSQLIYPPTLAPSLYERVAEHGQGTHDNPIQYDASVGMALENGKFYTEDDVLYECFRDSGAPVYNHLADLIGIYVEVSNE